MNGILYFILSRLYVYDVMNPRIDDDIVLCWVWACMDLKEHNNQLWTGIRNYKSNVRTQQSTMDWTYYATTKATS